MAHLRHGGGHSRGTVIYTLDRCAAEASEAKPHRGFFRDRLGYVAGALNGGYLPRSTVWRGRIFDIPAGTAGAVGKVGVVGVVGKVGAIGTVGWTDVDWKFKTIVFNANYLYS